MIRKLSDDAFVESIRKSDAKRTHLAVFALLLGLVFLVTGAWAMDHYTNQSLDRLERLTGGTDFEAAVTELSFFVGVKVGSAVASTALGGITIIFVGINLILGKRKDRLLLEYHRAITERSIGRPPS